MSEYDNILKRIKAIVEDKGYSIHDRYDEVEGAYIFEIKDADIPASYIQIYDDSSGIIKKRRSELQIDKLISVSSLSTPEYYRGQGLATLLISYGICFLKNKSPNIEYAILDDASDKSTMIKGNIYNQFGFKFRETPKKDQTDPNKVVPFGAEKQLSLDNTFITKVTKLLNTKFPRDYNDLTPVVGKAKKSKQVAYDPLDKYKHDYGLRSLSENPRGLRSLSRGLRSLPKNPYGGKKSNRKTKKYKRKTKKRRY